MLLRGYLATLSLEAVWKELEVFSKLVVRGRNQHRRDKCYQMLARVCKDLKHYQKAKFLDEVRKFVKRPIMEPNQVESVVKKVSLCLQFTNNLVQFLEKTSKEVEKQLHMGLFVPTNLVMTASLSRVWAVFYYHSQVLSALLSKLSPTQPSPLAHVHLNPESNHQESPHLGVAIARVETEQTALAQNSGTADSAAPRIVSSALNLEQKVVRKQTGLVRVNSLDTKPSISVVKTRRNGMARVAIMNGSRRVWVRVRRHVGGTRTHFSPSSMKVMGTRRMSGCGKDFLVSRGLVLFQCGVRVNHRASSHKGGRKHVKCKTMNRTQCRTKPSADVTTPKFRNKNSSSVTGHSVKLKPSASERKFKLLHKTFVKDLALASEEFCGGVEGTYKATPKQKSCTGSHERSIIDDLFGDI